MPINNDVKLEFPSEFEEYIVKAKGYIFGLKVSYGNRLVTLNFYDHTRLEQDITAELDSGRMFHMHNLVVLDELTAENIIDAVERLASSGQL